MSEDIVAYTPANSNPLIPTANHHIGDVEQTTVNGRDLHAFLGIKKAYAHWVTTQLRRGRFVQGRDYEVFALEGINRTGGRPSTDHVFTTDAAKQIGMLSGTERGVQIREYFLACEKRVYQLESAPQPAPQVELEDPILRDMAQLNRILDQLIPMDAPRRQIHLHMLKERHGLDLFSAFTFAALPASEPDRQDCKSMLDLLDSKRIAQPEEHWFTWLYAVGVVHARAHPICKPELTKFGRTVAYIKETLDDGGKETWEVMMDREEFEKLYRKHPCRGRTYNDNHGW